MSIGCKPLNDTEQSLILNSLPNLRDKCLFLLGLKTGFRISELLSIKVKDCIQYNTIKASITVERRNTKGKVASRTIPLSKDIQDALKAYIVTIPHQEYLFESQKGNKLSRIQAWRVIKDAALKNKLEGKIATHSMRKSYSKKIYETSKRDLVATQRAMGHKSVQSTISYLNFYTDDDINKLILKASEENSD